MRSNLILTFIACIFSLIIMEVVLRLNGRYETYVEKNKICEYVSPFSVGGETWYHVYSPKILMNNTVPFTTSFYTNNEGCRSEDFTLQKAKTRILCLGDSFTEGIGATEDSTFEVQLYNMLDQKCDVLNAGISGSDPVFEYRLFQDKLLKYKPDIVVITINSSDISDAIVRGGFERFKNNGTVVFEQSPWFEKYYAKSRLIRVLVHDIFKYDWQFNSPKQHVLKISEANHDLASAIDSFLISSSKNHFKLLFVFHPTFYEFKNKINYEFQPLIDYCIQRKINYVDVRRAFYSFGIHSSDAKRYYWQKDEHFNNSGYYYFAKSIKPSVSRLLK